MLIQLFLTYQHVLINCSTASTYYSVRLFARYPIYYCNVLYHWQTATAKDNLNNNNNVDNDNDNDDNDNDNTNTNTNTNILIY